jgi:hypothetical protein
MQEPDAEPEAVCERSGSRLRWWGVLLMLLALGALAWAAWKYVVRPRVLQSALTVPQTAVVVPELRVARRVMGK